MAHLKKLKFSWNIRLKILIFSQEFIFVKNASKSISFDLKQTVIDCWTHTIIEYRNSHSSDNYQK